MNAKEATALAVSAGLKANIKNHRVTLSGKGLLAPMSFDERKEVPPGMVRAIQKCAATNSFRQRKASR